MLKKPETPTPPTAANQPAITLKSTDASNNKYISTIRITSANTITPGEVQMRDRTNGGGGGDQRRYKHKSMYLEPSYNSSNNNEVISLVQKPTISGKETSMIPRSLTPASIIDVNYSTRIAEQQQQRATPHNAGSLVASDSNSHKTSIYVEQPPRTTPVPFSIHSNNNNNNNNKPAATYRIQDLVFRFVSFRKTFYLLTKFFKRDFFSIQVFRILIKIIWF